MYASASARSSSARCIRLVVRLPLGALELLLDGAAEIRELTEDLECTVSILRLRQPFELAARGLELCKQLFRARQGFFGAHHAAFPRTILPNIPLTSLAASSVAYRLASLTASSIATSSGTSSPSTSWTAMRRMLRSTAPSRSAVQPSDASVMQASSSDASAATASAVARAHSSTSPSYREASGSPVTSHW